MLDHFVVACAVEIVHSARCLPVGTFKSRRTYSSRTIEKICRFVALLLEPISLFQLGV